MNSRQASSVPPELEALIKEVITKPEEVSEEVKQSIVGIFSDSLPSTKEELIKVLYKAYEQGYSDFSKDFYDAARKSQYYMISRVLIELIKYFKNARLRKATERD